MFEPVRGGTRGGQAEFKWSDVSADKDREHYLGHSINAPTGRWQKNKDIHWYNREIKQTDAEREEEIRKIKEAEAEAIAAALGIAAPKVPGTATSGAPGTGANSIAVAPKEGATPAADPEKEERKRKKEEKRARKEQRRAEKAARCGERHRTRSLSRRRADDSDEDEKELKRRHSGKDRSRSRSPRRDRAGDKDGYDRMYDRPRRDRTPPRVKEFVDYGERERERERERDRRRWEENSRRDQPGSRWGRD